VGLTVGKDGKPNDVQVGAPIVSNIGKAALEAVQSWQFRPATVDGKSEISSGTILLECRDPAAAPRSTDGSVTSVGAGVSPPAVIFKPEPDYSEEARRAKWSGSVALSIVVDSEGRARNIRVVKNLGLGLDEEAIIAVNQWRFKPGIKDGQPVNVRATIEVSFRLL
jgi:TonB family protein